MNFFGAYDCRNNEYFTLLNAGEAFFFLKSNYLYPLPISIINGVGCPPVLLTKIADKIRAAAYEMTVARQHTVVSISQQ